MTSWFANADRKGLVKNPDKKVYASVLDIMNAQFTNSQKKNEQKKQKANR